MTLLQALILGTIQGLTEFLPVSSSAHLVLFQNLLGLHDPMLAFDVTVHGGTLLAIFLYYRRDISGMIGDTFFYLAGFFSARDRGPLLERTPSARLAGFVILASIPTGIIGLALKDFFESLFASVSAVGVAWVIMSVPLMLSQKFQRGTKRLDQMSRADALCVGLAQGVAIVPGISRSGSTILGGMWRGVEPKEAARFSFWVAIPAILGAGILEMKEAIHLFRANAPVLVAGFASSAVVGYLSIALLLRLIQRGKFFLFGFYCLAIGIFALLYGHRLASGA